MLRDFARKEIAEIFSGKFLSASLPTFLQCNYPWSFGSDYSILLETRYPIKFCPSSTVSVPTCKWTYIHIYTYVLLCTLLTLICSAGDIEKGSRTVLA